MTRSGVDQELKLRHSRAWPRDEASGTDGASWAQPALVRWAQPRNVACLRFVRNQFTNKPRALYI